MFGNGAAIGSAVTITKAAHQIIHRDLHPVQAVYYVEGAGGTLHNIAGQLIVTTADLTHATTTIASVLFSLISPFCTIMGRLRKIL